MSDDFYDANFNDVVFDARDYSFKGVKQQVKPLRKAYGGLISTPDSAGGISIPSNLANYLIDEIAKNQWCRKLFETLYIPNGNLTIPTITSGDTVYLMGEGADMTTEGGASGSSSSVTRPVWGSKTITVKKFAGLSGYTTEFQEDSNLSVAEITLRKMLRAFAEHEEKAFVQGEQGGAKFGWTSGDVRYAFDGLIDLTQGSNAATGAKWTPTDSTNENWIDAGSGKLTNKQLEQMIAKIEDNRGEANSLLVTPIIAARLRDKTEFEMLQGLKDVGPEAALIKGFVGRYYTLDIYQSHWLPTGDSVFNVSTADPKDALILAFDKNSPKIGETRTLEIMQRHRFYQDINEIRATERIGFMVEYPEHLVGLAQVQNAV